MFSKGITTAELRPFSVEDPFGEGILGPSAAERRLERHHRRPPPRARNHSASSNSSSSNKYSASSKSHSPDVRRASPANGRSAPKTKSRFLSRLVLIVALYAAYQVAAPFVRQQYGQYVARKSGTVATAQLISVSPTSISLNNKKLYDLELALTLPGEFPTNVELRQSFSDEVAIYLQESSWVEVRYNPQDLQQIVITKVGVSPQPDGPEAKSGLQRLRDVATRPAASDPQKGSEPAWKARLDQAIKKNAANPQVAAQLEKTKLALQEATERARKASEAVGAAKAKQQGSAPKASSQPANHKPTATSPSAQPTRSAQTGQSPTGASEKAVTTGPSAVCQQAESCCRKLKKGGCSRYARANTSDATCKTRLSQMKTEAKKADKTCQ